MAGLAGINPIQGWEVEQPEASAEERLGGPADPRHARPYWAVPERMPQFLQAWALSPASPDVSPGLLDPALAASAAAGALPAQTSGPGTPYYGATPITHAAPNIKGVETSIGPDASARRAQQSAAVHADGLGESAHFFSISALQDQWTDFYNAEPESPTRQQPVNGQVGKASGGFGSTDRVGNPDGVMGHGYQNAHMHRRYATGSVPGNYMWMRPAGRPMIKTTPGPARPPIGEASPFTGQDLTLAFGVRGAVLANAPNDYEAPADPYVAPPLSQSQTTEPAPVAWW